MFPQLDSTESRRHTLYQNNPICHENDTFSRELFAQGGSSSYILSPHYVTKSIINDTTFSSGIIKKINKKAKENTLPGFRLSYAVLFLTLNRSYRI